MASARAEKSNSRDLFHEWDVVSMNATDRLASLELGCGRDFRVQHAAG